jgi:glycosyltransferase involved in cell wall biosynthesis
MLAPPWITVPPSGYGGIETVIATLCDSLVRRGHDVTLFAAPGSHSAGRTCPVLDRAWPEAIGEARHEADHVATALDHIDTGSYDVVHDHCGYVGLAMADRAGVPVVHTAHGPFDEQNRAFYARHGHRALVVGLSRSQIAAAPAGIRLHGAIANPLDCGRWHPGEEEPGEHLVWLGRFARVKGAHRAIDVARRAGMPLVLAGVVQPGQESYFDHEIGPHVDGESVRFVGEVGGERKRRLLAGARALLMPIRWDEPFGMVMVEALACGTPTIAFPHGAAPEIIEDGRCGFLVEDERAMARAALRAGTIDRAACRARAEALCRPDRVAERYEQAYLTAMRATGRGPAPGLAAVSTTTTAV